MTTFIKAYFDFDYRIGALLFIMLFLLYMYMPVYGNRRTEGRVEKNVCRRDVIPGLLLCGYLVLVIGVTLLNRTMEESARMDMQIFWSYIESWEERNVALGKQIIYNILAFIPLGILLPAIYPKMRKWKRVVFAGFLLSVFIELNQLLWHCGLCELDDVINNTMGTLAGYLIYQGCKRIIKT